jgi:hypothetical protein
MTGPKRVPSRPKKQAATPLALEAGRSTKSNVVSIERFEQLVVSDHWRKAMFDLEGDVHDLAYMADLATYAATNNTTAAVFAVSQLEKMILAFQAKFLSAWRGDHYGCEPERQSEAAS